MRPACAPPTATSEARRLACRGRGVLRRVPAPASLLRGSPHCLATVRRCRGPPPVGNGGTDWRPRISASAGRKATPPKEPCARARRRSHAPRGRGRPGPGEVEAATSGVPGGTVRGAPGLPRGLPMERRGPRVGGHSRVASFPPLDGNCSVASERRLARPAPRSPGLVRWRPGGLAAVLAAALAAALCWPGEVGPRAGAGGSRRWVSGPSRDSVATLPSPSAGARARLGTGCVLLEVRRGRLFAFPGNFTWQCGHPKDTFLRVSPPGQGLGKAWAPGGDQSQVEGP